MALIDNLISYWKLDESSGNALDAQGSNDLVESGGTVGSAIGKINNARDFEAADTAFLTIADNASLSMGDIGMTLTAWIKKESDAGAVFVVGKYTSAAGQREYMITVNASEVPVFTVRNTADSANTTATWGSSTSAATWYFLVAQHDPTADTISISVNDGTPVTAATTGGILDGTSNFTMGSKDSGEYFDGLIDGVGLWKRVLTGAEITTLYNSGNGYEGFILSKLSATLATTGAMTATLTASVNKIFGISPPKTKFTIKDYN